MYWQNMSFLLRMKPKYCQVIFRVNIGPPIEERSSREELKTLRSGKMKDFSFSMFNSQTKLIQKRRNNIVTTK